MDQLLDSQGLGLSLSIFSCALCPHEDTTPLQCHSVSIGRGGGKEARVKAVPRRQFGAGRGQLCEVVLALNFYTDFPINNNNNRKNRSPK